MAEPFTELLTRLVEEVDGAAGAAFIDSYGEAVQVFAGDGDDEFVKLMGAYQGLALQTSNKVVAQLQAGHVDYLLSSYESMTFVMKSLRQDYFVMLVLKPEANVGQGIYRIRLAAAAFDREI